MIKLITNSGIFIDIENPQPEQISLNDIAISLSRLPRFTGMVNKKWTVLKHSFFTASLVPIVYRYPGILETPYNHIDHIPLSKQFNTKLRKHMLLHDAAEAYIADIPGPLKVRLPYYNEIDYKLTEAIYKKVGISFDIEEDLRILLKDIDHLALRIEATLLIGKKWYLYLPEDSFDFSNEDIPIALKRLIVHKFRLMYNTNSFVLAKTFNQILGGYYV